MTLPWLLSAAGLGLLLLAGHALVVGAVNLSLRLGVPALLVGITVVGFGTSAPELIVTIQAVLQNVPGIALGNVVGSNIANILLVIGVAALISRLRVSAVDVRRSYTRMLGASALFVALALSMGAFTRVSGAILLAGLAYVMIASWRDERRIKAAGPVDAATLDSAENVEGANPGMSTLWILTLVAFGIVGLAIGAELLVGNATIIARQLRVSEAVIGLTLVAVGTSLPELTTSVMAAFKRQAEMAIGNVVGSNLCNLLGVVGVAALVGPIPVAWKTVALDFGVMLAAAAILAPFVYLRRDITRGWGLAMLALYAWFVWHLLPS